jgi:hypothetical protein
MARTTERSLADTPTLNFFFAGFFVSQAPLLLFMIVLHAGRMDSSGIVRGRDFLMFYVSGQIVASRDGPSV